MGRDRTERRKRSASGLGRFVALPHVVIDSPAYRSLSFRARALLVDVARQYDGKNNGSLACTPKYLRPLGWRSNDGITKGLHELLERRLLVETRKGRFPSTAAWYALNWHPLDVLAGLDIDPSQYRTGAYLDDSIIPATGTRKRRVVPATGTRAANVVPTTGTVEPKKRPAPIPVAGEYLDQCHLPERESA